MPPVNRQLSVIGKLSVLRQPREQGRQRLDLGVVESVAAVRATVAELEPYSPPGVRVVYPLDNSPVVKASITSVVQTLFEAILLVFLCLAALYESWSIPATVLLVVPLGVLGAVAATLLRGLTNDAYF